MFVETDYVEESRRVLADMFRPETSVHVGVDFQKGYCLPGIGPEFLLASQKDKYDSRARLVHDINQLAATFRQQSIANIWVRHAVTFYEDHFCPNISAQHAFYCLKTLEKFAETAADLCVQHDPSHDRVIDKSGYDGFSKTPLSKELKRLKAQTVLLTGGSSDLCLLATAKSAVQKGFVPFIVADMTYGTRDLSNPFVREEYCLDRAGTGIYVVTSQQLLKVMSP